MRPFIEAARLMEDMSPQDARRFFQRLGHPDINDLDDLKKARADLVRKYHHDGGSTPSAEMIKTVNVAFAALRDEIARAPEPIEEDEADYTIWGWTERGFMRGTTVRCGPSQFPAVIEAAVRDMTHGFRRPRAIFLQRDGSKFELLLVYADGRDIRPRVLKMYAPDGNPAGDRNLVNTISRILGGTERPPAPETTSATNSSSDLVDRMRSKLSAEDEPESLWNRMKSVFRR